MILLPKQIVASLPAETFGAMLFTVTIISSVELQPFNGSETVRVYVPPFVVVVDAELAINPFGPDQAKLTPGEVDEPLRLAKVARQVIVKSAPAEILGGVLFNETNKSSVEEQPLTGLVTVKVGNS